MSHVGRFTRVWLAVTIMSGACHVQDPPTPAPVATPGLEPEVVPPKPATDFQDLALGRSHSCALRDDGAVYCWGDNSHGQIQALSGMELYPNPHKVEQIDDGVQLSASGNYTCVLTREGRVHCWGGVGYLMATPVTRIEGMQAPAVELITCNDGAYACARLNDGSVSCWGDPVVPGASGWGGFESPAMAISFVSDAIGLACSANITCARRSADEALCWGAVEPEDPFAPALSAVGDPPQILPPHAAAVRTWASPRFGGIVSCHAGDCWALENPPSAADGDLTQLRDLQVGPNHTCTLDNTGEVRCVGHTDFGMLGERTEAGAVDGVNASLLAVGDTHTCALDPHRGILCWGNNDKAQLGTGTWGEVVPRPTLVDGLTATGSLTASTRASDSAWQMIAVTEASGQIMWWGDYQRPSPAPTPFRVAEASLNGSTVCAISDSNRLFCADLAIATSGAGWAPLSPERAFIQLDAGGHHFCARDPAGHAWCWGINDKGALGDGTHADRQTPVPVLGLEHVAQIATGDAHSCARTSEGAVHCWGKNNQSRLGDGTTTWQNRPIRVAGIDDAIDLAIGKDTTCVVHADGRVACWGRRFGDGLGHPTVQATLEPAVSVSVGCDHACVVTVAGQVQCWGDDNRHGQLGVVPSTSDQLGAAIEGLPPVVRVTAGCFGTCAETGAGQVYCWGQRASIGDGQRSFSARPQPIALEARPQPDGLGRLDQTRAP